MNIDIQGYTREQLLSALFSSTRQVRFEYTIADSSDNDLGYLEVQNGQISFDSTTDVMRTLTGRVKKSDLLNMDTIDRRITPWMCLMMPNGKEARWALGKFIIYPSAESNNDINMIDISGYDLAKIALDDKSVSRTFINTDQLYTSAISAIVGALYVRADIETSIDLKSFPQEWEIGESKLKIVNDLLRGINYDPLHFDENGVAIGAPHISSLTRQIDFSYLANEQSIILDGITLASDKFDIPNKWIRYTENPEAAYLISTFINDNPDNPYSTVNRGRTIVDSKAVDDIANQDALDSYTTRVANEAMQATERIEFSTLNMPGHGYQECLWVDIPNYDISGKYIEVAWDMDLTSGGQMHHVCEKVVVL
jgi:hypothetical protein